MSTFTRDTLLFAGVLAMLCWLSGDPVAILGYCALGMAISWVLPR